MIRANTGAAFKKTLGDMFALINVSVPENFRDKPFPTHIATDSRSVQQGGAFVALEGAKVDGHKYAIQAAEHGAALIIVRKGKRPAEFDNPDNNNCNNFDTCVIELDEPEIELAQMASRYLNLCFGGGTGNLKNIVAVTGSVGKTTTRTALERVFASHPKKLHVHAATGSLNTRIGCTATVLAMPIDTELLLLEFGANKPGEIKELVDLFPPTMALITQVAPVHLEGFKSIEGVLNAKMEIATSRHLRCFLYNANNKLLCAAAEKLAPSIKRYGIGTGTCDSQINSFLIINTRFDFNPENNSPSLAFELSSGINCEGGSVTINAAVWGEYIALPLALASAAGNCLGMTLNECAEALRGFHGLPGRGRILTIKSESGDTRFVVDDAYNANPASMRASLETFVKLKRQAPDTCLAAVLGEMREMGTDAPKYHAELAPLIAELDFAVLVGDQNLWRLVPDQIERSLVNSSSKIILVPTWQEALEKIQTCEWHGLLAKGSLSVGLLNIVSALTGVEGGAH